MKVTIDRQKWLRGTGSAVSYLYRPDDQKMCCLGFFALQCGYSIESIEKKSTPMDVVNPGLDVLGDFGGVVDRVGPEDGTTYVNSGVAGELMRTNDQPFTPPPQREREITELFRSIGVEVEFIN